MSQFKDIKKDMIVIVSYTFGTHTETGIGFVDTDLNPEDPTVYISIKGGGSCTRKMSELVTYQIVDEWLLSRPKLVESVPLLFDYKIEYGIYSTTIQEENPGKAIDYFKRYYPSAMMLYKGKLYISLIDPKGNTVMTNAFE